MKAQLIIIAILVIIISGILLLSVSFQHTLQMEMAQQFNKQQLLLARSEASNILAYINRVKEEMFSIAQLASLFRVNDEALYQFLSKFFLRNLGKVKLGIKYLDSKGETIFTEGIVAFKQRANRYIPSNEEIIEIAERSCPSDLQVRQNSQRINIIIPVCRFDALVGAIITSIDIQDLAREFLGPIRSGSQGYAWMMDGEGNLLYHPSQPDMVGRNLYNTDTSCFNCHKSFDVEKKIVESKGDNYGQYVAPTGEDKVLAFSTITVGDAQWIVTVSAPYSEITMAIQSSRKYHLFLTVLIFLAVTVVSAVLIVLNRKRVRAEELEKHTVELEQKVVDRTQELTTEKEKLNTVVTAIGSGIMLIDNQRKILWINQMMKNIVGKDITGMQCDDFFTDCKIIGSYKSDNMQTDVLSNLFGQSDKYYQVTTAPVKGAEEDIQGFIRLVDDVTEIKKMEDQMMYSEKLALLGRLTTGIVNEIGNPLTSVFSFVQMLKEKEHDEFKKESLETIDLYTNKIADILKQLSGFSKINGAELKPCKVNGLIEDALSLLQYDKRVNDITIMRDLSPGIPMTKTDGNLLAQVIVNIVLNAADAMSDTGTLMIRSRMKGEDIVLTFEDTGTGISKENLTRIFDPLYTTKDKGTGLGLAVSQNIMEKLNGLLTVDSELGKGSKFVITLPVN
jgi:C4-dicarboxylate-specific signal transduction histidine kinase